jgi:RNA-binding protein
MPSTQLRRRLRGLGHALDPVVQVGKLGVTPSLLTQLTRAIADHELVKVKLGSECPEDRFAVAAEFGKLPGVKVSQILGRTILLYKKRAKNPKIEPATPPAKPAARKKPPAGKPTRQRNRA